jgi:hypothetical protein
VSRRLGRSHGLLDRRHRARGFGGVGEPLSGERVDVATRPTNLLMFGISLPTLMFVGDISDYRLEN